MASELIDNADLPVGFVAEQIAPVQRVDGVERVKIRDRSGKAGWVTPDGRPKGGHVFFEMVPAFPRWCVLKDGVRMRAGPSLSSAPIDNADLPVGFSAEQIAPAERVEGVERVKIRDRSGKEGWVTPDGRPKGGHVYFEKVTATPAKVVPVRAKTAAVRRAALHGNGKTRKCSEVASSVRFQ